MNNRLENEQTGAQGSGQGKSAETSLQVFDYNEFLDRVMGDSELAATILEEFTGLIDQHGEKLRDAVASMDHENVRQIGHLIKGESGNISAKTLFESAYAMEKAAKTKDSSTQNKLLPEVLENIDSLKKAIGKALAKEER